MTDSTLDGAAVSAGRRQLSEEFVTYKLMDLVDHFSANGAPIWIKDFGRVDESSNGADVELWFWDTKAALATGWLVQAKRLSPPETPPSSPRFESLGHEVAGRRQVDLLIDAARREPGLAPLFWLYSWDFPQPVRCNGLGRPCRCTPTGLDDVLLVAPAQMVARLNSRTWHSVVMKHRDQVESLRRMWCHASGSIPGLAAATWSLLAASDPDASDQQNPLLPEGPPQYVLDAFGLSTDDQRVVERAYAKQLALFMI